MITISRKKQSFSFLPIKVKVNNANYTKLSKKNIIEFEPDKNYIELKVKFLGLRKKLKFYKNTTDKSFEIFMNIDKYTSYVILAALLICFALVIHNVLTEAPNKKLIAVAVIFSIIYLLRIFQSINIKPKE